MRIVVSDSSCLIDLRKVGLLDTFLKLPYEFLIPDTLFHDELLKFTAAQKRELIRGGLKVLDLPGERVIRAQQVIRSEPRLSIHDGFAFALAEISSGCILLTGDNRLRQLATSHSIEVHGLLWIVDQMHENKLRSAAALLAAIRTLESEPAVRLPARDLAAYIKRYGSLR